MLRPALLVALLLPFAATHATEAGSSALAVSGDIYTLIAETTMVSIEVDPAGHAARARDVLTRLETTLPPVIAAIAGNDAARAADLAENWEDLRSAYEGERFAIAFREKTYDMNMVAHYTTGSVGLLTALDPAAELEVANAPEQQLRLRILKTITSYLKTSTGIVGGNSQSANDLDNDVPTGVAAVDRGLAQLQAKYAGTPKEKALRGEMARWSFLRPALLTARNQSAPFIVYTHGLQIAQALDELSRPPADAR